MDEMCSGCVKSKSVNISSTFFGDVNVILEAMDEMCSGCVKSKSVNMSSTFFGGVYVMLEARDEKMCSSCVVQVV
jgi:hypothetical protein